MGLPEFFQKFAIYWVLGSGGLRDFSRHLGPEIRATLCTTLPLKRLKLKGLSGEGTGAQGWGEEGSEDRGDSHGGATQRVCRAPPRVSLGTVFDPIWAPEFQPWALQSRKTAQQISV